MASPDRPKKKNRQSVMQQRYFTPWRARRALQSLAEHHASRRTQPSLVSRRRGWKPGPQANTYWIIIGAIERKRSSCSKTTKACYTDATRQGKNICIFSILSLCAPNPFGRAILHHHPTWSKTVAGQRFGASSRMVVSRRHRRSVSFGLAPLCPFP